MEDRAAPYVLAAGETRRDDAILPFKALADDTGGLLSVCEFTLGGWESGPVLHRHDAVDEAFYVVAGRLEAQLDDRRVQVLALALPGGVEELFAEQAAYLASVQGPPDPSVLDQIGVRHGAPTVGPPIRSHSAPETAQRRSPLPDG